MKMHVIMATVGVIGLVSACAQQEEVTLIAPQPTFDKFGNGSCDDGWIYVPGAAPINPCIPEDECQPVYDAAGNVIECLPPPREHEQEGDDSSGRQSPTGGATAGTASRT